LLEEEFEDNRLEATPVEQCGDVISVVEEKVTDLAVRVSEVDRTGGVDSQFWAFRHRALTLANFPFL
jgi:hypothetical protein